jgi:AcrR family transcriptional regulator
MIRKPKQNKASRARSRSAAKPAAARQAVRRTRAAAESPYHHGALREALLQAAEKVLERDGLPGLTLRAVAREAGVSHAAPTHHFGDVTGLLSELAAIGYCRFGAAMAAASTTAMPKQRGLASAKAYVAFALAHPGMYGLMFRAERLDMTRPALRDAADSSFAGFAAAIGANRGEQISTESLTLEQAGALTAMWSLMHGFSTLLLDGRLTKVFRGLPEGTKPEALLLAMLMSTLARAPAR